MKAWHKFRVPAAVPSDKFRKKAIKRQASLTKPLGALGRVENLAVQLAALQCTETPQARPCCISIFAGDHGVAVEGVSAYPQSVTAQMVHNVAVGGAAISVLADRLGLTLEVINLGTVGHHDSHPRIVYSPIASSTANCLKHAAMTKSELSQALEVGRKAAVRARDTGMSLFIGGELGIGNTTVASAMGSALTGLSPTQMVGPGTGLDAEGVTAKIGVVSAILCRHGHAIDDPMELTRRLGGFEIAALVAAFISCSQFGIPILVDGFISTVAACVAARICFGSTAWMIHSHSSAEPGHKHLLKALGAEPLFSLSLRLGEGSGAALAWPLMDLACALHNEMATFESAGVSGSSLESTSV